MAFNYSKVLKPQLVNELRVGYAKTEPFTKQSDYGTTPRNPWASTASTSTRSRPGCRTSASNFTGLSGARRSCP